MMPDVSTREVVLGFAILLFLGGGIAIVTAVVIGVIWK